MAAPIGVYSTSHLKAQQGSATAEILTLMALSLSEYKPTPTATPEQTRARVCELFYLDFCRQMKDKNGNDVFIGGVYSGSTNYAMHNASRLGRGRVRKDGIDYTLLNDAGLNTKGAIEVMALHSNSSHGQGKYIAWGNYFRASFKFKASYYATSNLRRITVSAINGSGTAIITPQVMENTSGMTQRQEETLSIVVIRQSPASGVKYGINVEHTNEEGTSQFVIAASSGIVAAEDINVPIPIMDYYGTTMPTSTIGGTPMQRWSFASQMSNIGSVGLTAASSGIYLYKSDKMNLVANNVVAAGYYDLGYRDALNKVKMFIVDSNGMITHYEPLFVTTIYKKFIPTVDVNSMGDPYIKIETSNGNTGVNSAIFVGIKFWNGTTYLEEKTFISQTITIGDTVSLTRLSPPTNADYAQLVPQSGQTLLLSEQYPKVMIPITTI